jgi:hypothetical protein
VLACLPCFLLLANLTLRVWVLIVGNGHNRGRAISAVSEYVIAASASQLLSFREAIDGHISSSTRPDNKYRHPVIQLVPTTIKVKFLSGRPDSQASASSSPSGCSDRRHRSLGRALPGSRSSGIPGVFISQAGTPHYTLPARIKEWLAHLG